MRIFFLGGYKNPGGPNEVNRNLLSVIKNRVSYITQNNSYLCRAEILLKIVTSKVIICSGLFFKSYELMLMRILRKKIVYIMHGCAYKELGFHVKQEDEIIKYSDLILCVSNIYKNQIASKVFPLAKQKMKVLHNPINWQEYTQLTRKSYDPNRIILIGGGRSLKKNYQVCLAVNEINQEFGTDYYVDVFGYYRENDDSKKIADVPNVKFHHVIPHQSLLNELSSSHLFVQNSEFESFGLGVIDALSCGCDVLISQYVGSIDIIKGIEKTDLINNPLDVQEIKSKILFILSNSNNKRLCSSIDKTTTSKENLGNKLLEIVNKSFTN